MGMFLGWAILAELASPEFLDSWPDEIADFKNRRLTAPELFESCCDNKLTDEDLSEEGNRFARDYYEGGRYFDDYVDTAMTDDMPSVFHVPDDWPTFENVRVMLDQRYAQWKQSRPNAN
jgi:hypothetical protein